MKCKNARILISAAADGELSQRESLALDEHLASCADCRRERKAVGGLRRAMTAWEPAEPAESLTDAFMLRLSREREAEAHSWHTLFLARLPAYGMASAAAVVILAAVYIATMKPSLAPANRHPDVAVNQQAPEKPRNNVIATAPQPEQQGPVARVAEEILPKQLRHDIMAYIPRHTRRHRIPRWNYAEPALSEQPIVVAMDPTVKVAKDIAESLRRDKEREKIGEQAIKIAAQLTEYNTKIEEGVTKPGTHPNDTTVNSGSGESRG